MLLLRGVGASAGILVPKLCRDVLRGAAFTVCTRECRCGSREMEISEKLESRDAEGEAAHEEAAEEPREAELNDATSSREAEARVR